MEISAILTDANGTLLTGKAASTALKIRRVADGSIQKVNSGEFLPSVKAVLNRYRMRPNG